MSGRGPRTQAHAEASSAARQGLTIRRATVRELGAVRRLVALAVEEVYGSLFPAGMPEDRTDWREALVAVFDGKIVGVALTSEDTVDDLWISADHRRRGVGRALLASAESEIQQRDYRLARLRVVADNAAARRFYAAHRWSEAETYPHERWGFPMVNMIKELT